MKRKSLSGDLAGLFGEMRGVLTIGRLVDTLAGRGFGILLALISLPSAVPVPAVGYSIPFGLVIALLGLQLIWGRTLPWLPQKLCKREVPRLVVELFTGKGIRFLRKIERLLRPRIGTLSRAPLSRRVVGLVVLLMGSLMMIPIPGTNTIPGFSVLLLGLGLAGNDGLFILGGLSLGITITGLYLAALIVGGEFLLRLFI
ncbi:exopolysaccharide biosynthesis protein [Candidatus Bipolaricaulota bacterium]|nr:exopolysaccharide biosynthesis protein [Candidatus Bipolaricaulota bacterium]